MRWSSEVLENLEKPLGRCMGTSALWAWQCLNTLLGPDRGTYKQRYTWSREERNPSQDSSTICSKLLPGKIGGRGGGMGVCGC